MHSAPKEQLLRRGFWRARGLFFHWRMRLRTAYWRFWFLKMGEGCHVYGPIFVHNPERIQIGKSSTLNELVILNAQAPIEIGNYVRISSGVIFNPVGLNYRNTMGQRDHVKRAIIVEDGVWIGSGAILNPGTIIRRNSVIGAGAVVTGEIPANVVAVGVPARAIKSIQNSLTENSEKMI